MTPSNRDRSAGRGGCHGRSVAPLGTRKSPTWRLGIRRGSAGYVTRVNAGCCILSATTIAQGMVGVTAAPKHRATGRSGARPKHEKVRRMGTKAPGGQGFGLAQGNLFAGVRPALLLYRKTQAGVTGNRGTQVKASARFQQEPANSGRRDGARFWRICQCAGNTRRRDNIPGSGRDHCTGVEVHRMRLSLRRPTFPSGTRQIPGRPSEKRNASA
jgi:hypothetical protein